MPGKKDLKNVSNSQEECGLGEQKPTGMDLWSFTAVILTSEGNTMKYQDTSKFTLLRNSTSTRKIIITCTSYSAYCQAFLDVYKHTLEIWCILGVVSKSNSKTSSTPQLAFETLIYLLLN